MPNVLSAAARTMSSVQRELPPSTIVSPRSRSLARASTVFCVGSPAGTMIHTIRGADLLGALDGLLVEVERDDLVVRVAPDAVDHVAAHAAQSDEPDLTQESVSLIVAVRSRSAAAASGP